MALRTGFLLLLSSLAAAAGAEELRVYPEPGGLHVVVGDLISTASYRVAVYDGAATRTVALDADGEAWAFPADPAPRLLSVTVLRGGAAVLAATAATGDPAALVDDGATSVALAALAQQRAAVVARFKGQDRLAVEAAFDAARVDLLAVRRAVGREVYFVKARAAKVESVRAAAKLEQKIPKTVAGDRK
jgi:hypothetical protein